MPRQHWEKKRPGWAQFGVLIAVIAVVLVGVSIYAARRYYHQNLQPASTSQNTVTITIPKGSSVSDVAVLLSKNQLIRNDWAFKQYIRNKDLQDKILAGTYAIKPSQSVEEIVTILTEGKISSNLITIKPGQRIDQVKQGFVNAGYDSDVVDAAFEPGQYRNHPALVDKPDGVSLEGYLYPESFQKTSETTPVQIITKSLDEMQKRLTPEIRAAFAGRRLSVYQAITLASVVEREVSTDSDRAQVAQVFLSRIKSGKRLESDATASYGAIIAGKVPSLTYDSPYNTYYNDGLPVGPISNVSKSSLQAVAEPAKTDWLYFVSGDDGVTYFSKTLAEHEALTAQHCKKLCS